jgi:hypothetical protein
MSQRNRWGFILPVALLIAAGCVDRRVIILILPEPHPVQESNSTLKPEPEKSKPEPVPATRRIALPVCHMTACDSADTSCRATVTTAVRQSVADANTSLIHSLGDVVPLGIRTFSASARVPSARVDDAKQAWSGIGCVRKTGVIDPNDEARLDTCRASMPRWIDLINQSRPTLQADPNFRQTCEYEIMGIGGG